MSIPKYHIPALIYAPKFVRPAKFERMASQIDIAPSVLGMLGMSYDSLFLGHNVLDARAHADEQRAFIANYQEVSYLRVGEDGVKRLVVFAPKKRVNIYRVGADGKTLTQESDQQGALVREALGYYQGADYLLKQRIYHAAAPRPSPAGAAQAN